MNQMPGKILRALLIGGAWAVAATSPYFIINLMRHIDRESKRKERLKARLKEHYSDEFKERFRSAFYSLKRRELIDVENRGGQIYISLTEEGKKEVGKYQINDLKIKKPKIWDGKWYVLIFDIQDKQKIKREVLRGKIKELGLLKLQESVWIYPYDFGNEMGLLRDFFGLTKEEMRLMVVCEIENESHLKKYFNLQ
jgi:hypothetical protein